MNKVNSDLEFEKWRKENEEHLKLKFLDTHGFWRYLEEEWRIYQEENDTIINRILKEWHDEELRYIEENLDSWQEVEETLINDGRLDEINKVRKFLIYEPLNLDDFKVCQCGAELRFEDELNIMTCKECQ